MTATELLAFLKAKSVELEVDGDILRYRAAKGVMTDALRERLRTRKDDIIALLRSQPAQEEMSMSAATSGPTPASFAQQRLWFLDQISGGNASYNQAHAVRISGRLDVGALERSLAEIVARHDILRTSFDVVDGQPVQIGAPVHEVVLTPIMLENTELHEHMLSVVQRIFDLHRGPLYRFELVRLAAEEHVLLAVAHHIVCDGWSIGIMLREVAAFYTAYSQGMRAALPPLPLQYRDYAQWQRSHITGERLANLAAYWKKQLSGASALTTFASHAVRPTVPSYRGATHWFVIPKETTSQLRKISAEAGATLFMALVAVFSVLLARYSGHRDVCLGTSIANRSRANIEGLIGCFANTLVLRSHVDCGNFREFLAQVRNTVLQAYEHQDMPFEQVVDSLNPERSTSFSPLFQVMLILQNAPLGQIQLSDLRVTEVPVETGISKFDLSLILSEQQGSLAACIEYSTDLYDAVFVETIASGFVRMLDAVALDPSIAMAKLPVLSQKQRELQLLDWNATAADRSTALGVHLLFEQQVRRTPQRSALTFRDETITYAELNLRANQLAHRLRGLGAGPDTLVGLCMTRSIDLVVSVLAVLKAGAAYLPLDPAYPVQRLSFMLEHAAPVLVVTGHSLPAGVGNDRTRVLVLDAEREQLAQLPASDPDVRCAVENLAYVIYTSGSTGQPKGVAISHANLLNFIGAMRAAPGIDERDVLLSVTSLSFDIAALELFLPLVCGARVVLADSAMIASADALKAGIERHRISVMQATPSTWRMLIECGWPVQDVPLKVLCGGEALPATLAAQLLRNVPEIWNLYGPTETTVWSASCRLNAEVDPILIGRPVANTQIYVLDDELELLPCGAIGELYISGDGVARGYLKRPDLTAQQFMPNPFAAAGSRMYKTGDLARLTPDGRIECVGRADHQVKIRGFRIELGEVEAALNMAPGVREAVALARQDDSGSQQLLGYVVTDAESALTREPTAVSKTGFSLFYFGADGHEQENKYELYLKGATFADENGFEAVWTPERHFHEVGGLYPNPAVLNAALATMTSNVQLRAGSVVLPLHSPVRVAEEWATVDNLSGGRVGMAIASGWHPRDFVLAPHNYSQRKEVLTAGIATLRTLWAGEPVALVDGAGNDTSIRLFPRPLQTTLPLWITAAANPETFIQAGRTGVNVLTHLLGQSVSDLAQQIARYRTERERAGLDPTSGRVTLMLHTLIGEDYEQTIEKAREPFIKYLRAHVGLMESVVKSLGISVDGYTDQDIDGLVSGSFARYTRGTSLIGTPDSCAPLIRQLSEIGVNEIACLIDWLPCADALAGLPGIVKLKILLQKPVYDVAALREHLRTRLPEYMIPNYLVELNAMPRTPNGKVDRRALPIPQAFRPNRPYVAPRTPTEETLAGLWRDVLKVDRIGVYDNFFDLGGHSLLAMQLLSTIDSMFEVKLDPRLLFEKPNIASIAELIESIIVAEIAQMSENEVAERSNALSHR